MKAPHSALRIILLTFTPFLLLAAVIYGPGRGPLAIDIDHPLATEIAIAKVVTYTCFLAAATAWIKRPRFTALALALGLLARIFVETQASLLVSGPLSSPIFLVIAVVLYTLTFIVPTITLIDFVRYIRTTPK